MVTAPGQTHRCNNRRNNRLCSPQDRLRSLERDGLPYFVRFAAQRNE
jgi:hypothetical protein